MKWIVIVLLMIAVALFLLGVWTKHIGQSADERVGGDIAYVLAVLVLAFDVLLLAGWAVKRMISG